MNWFLKLSSVHPSKWLQPSNTSATPAPHSTKAAEFSHKKLHTFYPLPPAADIRHFKWDGLLYVTANQGFVSSGHIHWWRYTICEECQIFGTEVWNCHLIVYRALVDTQRESIWRKWLKDLTRINFKLTLWQKKIHCCWFFSFPTWLNKYQIIGDDLFRNYTAKHSPRNNSFLKFCKLLNNCFGGQKEPKFSMTIFEKIRAVCVYVEAVS